MIKHTNGFTLIELMVAVAVFAVLATVAAPSFTSFMQSNRLTSATNDLVVTLNLARSEAVKRATPVKVCIANSTLDDCNTGSTDWEDGWIVFIDDNANDAVDGGEKVLRVVEDVAGGTTLRSDQFASVITYLANGRANSIGAFRICDEDANVKRGRGINISRTGQIAAAKDTNSDDIRNVYTDANGSWGELSCT